MASRDDQNSPDKKLSRAEVIAQRQEAFKAKQKARAKELKKAYLAKPEVQAKLKARKEKMAAQRKAKSKALKEARKSEKTALRDSQKSTRERRQQKRDEELMTMLGRASNLGEAAGREESIDPPRLTLIKGGRSDLP